MASVVRGNSYRERRLGERRRFAYPALLRADGMKVSWGGIFGGVLVALGLLLMLAALGVAVGVSAVQPGETQASTLGTGAGIWAGVSLLLVEKAKSSGALTQKAGEVKPQASKAAWIAFGALLLSLLAAVIGAMAGRRKPVEEVRT